MLRHELQAWTPADATDAIRKIGCDPRLSLAYKVHATQRMAERGITISDILWLLKRGFVHQEATPATQKGRYKYVIEGPTPNSEGRTMAAVVIPVPPTQTIKVVTVFWVDETSTKSGTLKES